MSIRCATRVACAWRGYFVRKQLKAAQLFFDYKCKKTVVIQCFVRCVKARVELRRRKAAFQQFVAERRDRYNQRVLQEIFPQLQWQRAMMADAAIKLQRTFRWCLKNRNLPAEERDPFPVKRRPIAKTSGKAARANSPGAEAVDESARQYVGQVVPWTPKIVQFTDEVSEDYIMRCNAESRKMQAFKNHALQEPYSVQRHHENKTAIVMMDIDGCAAIIQRRWRAHRAETSFSTRKIVRNFYDHYAAIIQRAVRCHFSRRWVSKAIAKASRKKQLRSEEYNRLQVESLKNDITWNRFTIERAAMVVQRAWRFKKGTYPSKPPYGLMEDTRSPERRRRQAPIPEDYQAPVYAPLHNDEDAVGNSPANDEDEAQSTEAAADAAEAPKEAPAESPSAQEEQPEQQPVEVADEPTGEPQPVE